MAYGHRAAVGRRRRRAAWPPQLGRTGRMYNRLPYPADPADWAAGLLDVRKALAVYARTNHGLPLEELKPIQAVVTGSCAQVCVGLSRYVAAGARRFVCRPAAVGLRALGNRMERIAALIPALRAL